MMTALLTSAPSYIAIELQPGTVEVKQGNNVSLWCKINNYAAGLPVQWQSLSNRSTITENCVFGKAKYYVIPCTEGSFKWYNLTIMDVQWADKGKYRCHHAGNMGAVDLQVLVPVTDVSMSFIDSNGTVMTTNTNSMADQSLLLSPDITVELTCTTSCAYPAPTISWFENDQTFKDATIKKTEGCTGAEEGQQRTISRVTVTGKYVDKDRKEATILCMAKNFIAGPYVSTAINIIYNVTSIPHQPRVAAAGVNPLTVVALVSSGILATSLALIIVYKKLIRNKLGNIWRNRQVGGNESNINMDLPGSREMLVPSGAGMTSNHQDTEVPVWVSQVKKPRRNCKKQNARHNTVNIPISGSLGQADSLSQHQHVGPQPGSINGQKHGDRKERRYKTTDGVFYIQIESTESTCELNRLPLPEIFPSTSC